MANISSLNILIIEDDADTRANLKDILELDDHHVESAATAAEALKREDWSEISVVILDRKLPDSSAEELLPLLKRRASHAEVIIATAYADLDSALLALREGAADYILKPINPDALRASLSRISELKQSEERLRRSERLAAIGTTITGLAHESRNALQRSQACLEMLARRVPKNPEALDLIARIQIAQDQLHQLFEEVRAYASPIKLQKSKCNLMDIWREAWNTVQLDSTEKKPVLIEKKSDTNLTFSMDAFRIEQIFRNLFENAVSAADEPVEIEIECSTEMLVDQSAIRVVVRDNGPGLDAEQIRRIFDPFYTTKTKGTGLGMAIVRRIVESHGGTIEVGNGEDRGAEIFLTFPVPINQTKT